jgi:hypothetical protein
VLIASVVVMVVATAALARSEADTGSPAVAGGLPGVGR